MYLIVIGYGSSRHIVVLRNTSKVAKLIGIIVWVCGNISKNWLILSRFAKPSPYISATLTGLLDLPSDRLGLSVDHKRRVSQWLRRWSWLARKLAIRLPIFVDSLLASSVLPFLRRLFRLVSKDLTVDQKCNMWRRGRRQCDLMCVELEICRSYFHYFAANECGHR